MDAEKSGTIEPWRPDPIPYQLNYVWAWFLELHVARHFGPKGRPLPISYQDMVSWSMLTDRKVGPFEIKLIRQLDQRYFYVLANPTGGLVPKYVDQEKTDNGVAAMLRALIKKPQQSMTELPQGKPVVPVLTFNKSGKSK